MNTKNRNYSGFKIRLSLQFTKWRWQKIKIKQKYLIPAAIFLVIYLIGLLVFNLSKSVISAIYAYLNYLAPDTFPVYNQIYDPELHANSEKIFSVVTIFVALFIINLIALRIDNKKYERIVGLSDGQYLIKDGIKLYLKEFFVSDAIISTVIPAIMVIPAYFISDKLMEFFGLIIPCWLGYHLELHFSLPLGMLIAASFSFIGRMLSIPHCVSVYRAAWLSDI